MRDRQAEGARRRVALPLAQLVPGVTRPAFRRRSPAGARLMSEWAIIVGPRLAAETEPRRLAAGHLTIACSGPTAMELQHLAPVLIERINTFLGGETVTRVRFTQGALAPPPAAVPAAADPAVVPEPLPELPPGPLNAALARLRAAIRQRG